jgi:hypothetical protein
MSPRELFTTAGVFLACIFGVPSVFIYLFFVVPVTGWNPFDACTTETRSKIFNLSGFDFEISETDCDLIAKDESITVSVSKAGGNRKTPLIKYTPVGWPNTLPSIAVPDHDKFLISIPKVSSVFFERRKWKTISIDYAIGHIDYPDVSFKIIE